MINKNLLVKRQTRIWEWSLLLVSPFVFSAIFKIFPINYTKVLVIGAIFFFIYFIAEFKFQIIRHGSPMIVGLLFILYLLSTPFWAMNFDEKISKKDSNKFAIYFRDARADPEAFSKWWAYYVSEVVRTNKIIFKFDSKGKKIQGTYPYLPIPNAKTDFYKGKISINNVGYRGDDFIDNKKNIYRILTVGDSTTFGQTIFPDSQPWSAVLQQLIATDMTCNKKIEVVNGGVNSFHLANSIERIERDHHWLLPDMVISYIGFNSMAELGVYPQVITPPTLDTLSSPTNTQRILWYLKKTIASIANEEILNVRRAFLMGGGNKTNKELMSLARKGQIYQNYVEMIDQSRRLKYKLVLLNFNSAVTPESPEFVMKFYEGPWPGIRSIVRQIEIHNQMLNELATKVPDITYIDVNENLLGEYNANKYIDIVHFSPLGDKIMAQNVFKKLRVTLLKDESLQCRPRL